MDRINYPPLLGVSALLRSHDNPRGAEHPVRTLSPSPRRPPFAPPMQPIRPLQLTQPSPTTIHIERTFDAPVATVWRAFVEPERVKQWMTGPPGHTLPVCEIDFRVGGKARYVWKNSEFEMGMDAEFQEIVPNERIVQIEAFDGFESNAYPVTSTFVQQGGRTLLQIHIDYGSQEFRDAWIQPGFEEGYEASFATLDGLLSAG